MLSYVKRCTENGYTISFEPNLQKLYVFLSKNQFDVFLFFCINGYVYGLAFVRVGGHMVKYHNMDLPNSGHAYPRPPEMHAILDRGGEKRGGR